MKTREQAAVVNRFTQSNEFRFVITNLNLIIAMAIDYATKMREEILRGSKAVSKNLWCQQ